MSCKHIGCGVIGDGECHLDADGWMINITREQHKRVAKRLGVPNDALARHIRESVDLRELLLSMMKIAETATSARDRKAAQKLVEQCRQMGIPREPWKEH